MGVYRGLDTVIVFRGGTRVLPFIYVFNFSSDRLLLAELWLFLYFTVRRTVNCILRPGPKSKILKIRVSIFSSIDQLLAELRLFLRFLGRFIQSAGYCTFRAGTLLFHLTYPALD